MSPLPDGTMEYKDNDQYSYSSEFSSSSSSWNSSSDEDSSSSDEESDRSSVSSSPSTRKRQRRRQNGYFEHTEDSYFRLTSLMRNRRTHGTKRLNNHDTNGSYSKSSSYSSSEESYSSKHRKKNKSKKTKSSFHWSTILLVISLLIYCVVQITTTKYIQTESWSALYDEIQRDNLNLQNIHLDYQPKPVSHIGSHKRPNKRPHHPVPGKKESKEKLQPGCAMNKDWQTHDTNSRLLACQLLHEMDLLEALSVPSRPSPKSKRDRVLSADAFLGSGLWRDVWKLNDSAAAGISNNHTNFVVLKTMKPEHEVVLRNLERHRREAATMNQLTKSPNVADLFAYCGNSILTEFASRDLEHTLRDARIQDHAGGNKERPTNNKMHDAQTANQRNLAQQEPGRTRNDSSVSLLSSDTSSLATRIDWAIQASSAVADLHQVDVIHADITAKQFLLVSSNDQNIRIKLNDFNRCRFVPRRTTIGNATSANVGDVCPVRIPSAPGTYRSPEEYANRELTTQMDVYSLGNVLYEIWTNGKSAWKNRSGGKRVKQMVMDGDLPTELERLSHWDDERQKQKGVKTEDVLLDELHREFGRIIRKCYIVDPKERITADGLVHELTQLLERVPIQGSV